MGGEVKQMEEEKNKKETTKKKLADDGIIFIGQKPFMNYVTAVVMQFTTKKQQEVKVIARGKFISKAVDVVEVAKNKFLKGKDTVRVKEGGITISSEKFEKKEEGKEPRPISVSAIEIILEKVN